MNKTNDWDFKSANTKEYTHIFHTYPAMMIPQIARKLITQYAPDNSHLLDPFVGSGTSIVEGSLSSKINKLYGFDLNPLAVLITKVKTTPLDPKLLEKTLLLILNKKSDKVINPVFKNIDFWFKKEVILDISKLKKSINEIEDENIKNFFKIVFSETVRRVSNAKNGEFKLVRMKPEKLANYNPDTFKEFEKIAKRNITGMIDYFNNYRNKKSIYLDIKDCKKLPLSTNSIDIIVTSPPYGDSRTTVAYGQFSRLALQWLDFEEVNIDNILLGGGKLNYEIEYHSKDLNKIIKDIEKIDKKRSLEVLKFFIDFEECVIEFNRVLKTNGIICFVVGNRTVKGFNIPTHEIMMQLFEYHGNFKRIDLYNREIPNKRMPSLNSPSNKKGIKITTMTKEIIFILKKL